MRYINLHLHYITLHTVRGVSERAPTINQGPHHIQSQASINEVWVLVLGLFMFLSSAAPGST